MYPIALDLTKIPVLLVGQGEAFERRKLQLAEATKLICRDSFNAYDVEDVAVVMVAGLSREESAHIADTVRAEGKLVNVEDVNDLCDFYFMAKVTRGDLLIAVSTGGASPTLARRVRDYIGGMFGEAWVEHTQMIKELRTRMRAEGKPMKDIIHASEQFLSEKGLLK